MLSFIRRTPKENSGFTPQQPPPLPAPARPPKVLEPAPPPPPQSARAEKERSWLASIRGKGKGTDPTASSSMSISSSKERERRGIGYTVSESDVSGSRGKGSAKDFLAVKPKKSTASLRSTRSRKSLRIFGFGTNDYDASNANVSSGEYLISSSRSLDSTSPRRSSFLSAFDRHPTRPDSTSSDLLEVLTNAAHGQSSSKKRSRNSAVSISRLSTDDMDFDPPPHLHRRSSSRASGFSDVTLSTSEGFTLVPRPPPNPTPMFTTDYASPYSLPGTVPTPSKSVVSRRSSSSLMGMPIQEDPAETDANTKSLATRLEQLATSHAGGLLDDQEYRILRGELFERFAAGDTANGGLDYGIGNTGGRIRWDDNGRPPPPASPSAVGASRGNGAPSFTSTSRQSQQSKFSNGTGVSSLFRRATSSFKGSTSERSLRKAEPPTPSRSSTLPSHNGKGTVNMSDSQLYAVSVEENGTRSMRTNLRENSSVFSSSRSLQSTIPSSASILTAATSNEDVLSMGQRTSYSLPSTSRVSRSHSMTGKRPNVRTRLDSWGAEVADLPGDDPTSEELKQEIMDLEQECKRVVESFEGLEVRALTKYKATPTNHGLALPPELQHLLTKITGDSAEKTRSSSLSVDRGNDWESITSNRNSLRRMSSKIRIGRSSSQIMRSEQIGSSKKPPSSFPANKLSDADLKIGKANGRGEREKESALLVDVKPASEEDQKLIQELEDLRKRRRAVEEKYEIRLGYLKARLTGALIKEGISK